MFLDPGKNVAATSSAFRLGANASPRAKKTVALPSVTCLP